MGTQTFFLASKTHVLQVDKKIISLLGSKNWIILTYDENLYFWCSGTSNEFKEHIFMEKQGH